MVRHPYREPASRSCGEPPEAAPKGNDSRVDDVALAVILFVVGAIGLIVGVCCDRATELTAGLVLVALAAKVAWETRQISI